VRGFVEHDGSTCFMGTHSNRSSVTEMCPVFLALRRTRLKNRMRELRFERKTGLGLR
jgi:hypothetical protein